MSKILDRLKPLIPWRIRTLLLNSSRIFSRRKASDLPPIIQISPSDACNFKCAPCWIHGGSVVAGEDNYEVDIFSQIKPGTMKLDVYKKLITDIANNPSPVDVQFCGKGDPSQNLNLLEMIEIAHAKGISSSLVTNGSRLSMDFLIKLSKMGVAVNVSLNASDPESHKSFSGIKKDYFSEIVGLLKEFNASSYGNNKMSLSFVIGSYNIAHIPDMVRLAGSILRPSSGMWFYPDWTHSRDRENNCSEEQIADLVRNMPEIKKAIKEFKLCANIDILPYVLYCKSVSDERDIPTRKFYANNPCTVTEEFLVISADGRVFPCCRSGYTYGDINVDSIHDVWMSEKAIWFRTHAQEIHINRSELPLSHCYSCDHIMGNNFFKDEYSRKVADLLKDKS